MKSLILFFNIFLLSLFNSLFAFNGKVLFLKENVLIYDNNKKTESILKYNNENIKFNNITVKTKNKSKVILFLNDEIEIRCNENSEVYLAEDYIKILSGKIWIRKLKSINDLKLKTGNKKYTIKYGSFNIDADKKSFKNYNGVAYVSGKEIKQETEFPKSDTWLDWNLKYDKIELAVVYNNEEYKAEIENTVKRFFNEKYLFYDFNTYGKFSENLNADIILDCDISVNTGCIRISAILKDGVTYDTLNLIDNNCDESDITRDVIQDKLLKVFTIFLNSVDREYVKKIIKEGRNIVIDAEISSDDDIVLLEKYIETIPGVKNIKKMTYYGQKGVFFIKYYGTGYDLKDYFEDEKTGKNKINIWKYSKNLVKLKLVNN